VTISVAVADDSLLVREGLERILAGSPAVELVAACADYESLVRAIEQYRPELVMTDARLSPSNTDEGIRIATELRANRPDVGVVILSDESEPAHVLELLESGSDRRGYLLKDRLRDAGDIVSAIDTVARGGSIIDPKVVEVLVAAKAHAGDSALSDLTPREREVLAQIAEGKSNLAIAGSLSLTKRGVEKHINSIFMKLGLASADDVSKRVKATLLFLADG
jgi:DNA-binding NarL/FixJ family response regulator